ncbi:hypothetical protein [Curtobacterium sp. VKM Ac-1393]|uniref:hypothetical protein n=1 Tax=Curtobacterium sp. VKM Ac-1393 TaxID=2783814 RepID=UPI00188BCCD2|nr:hypothetical protein [Curtobacterium sp. VKM Ac-1393]MBF4608392.1 hypothetical protein [Curtobacterium sp. VKM Ac-1393]
MTPFAARCVLVGTAILLVLAGLLAPVAGWSRPVLFAAGGCCAVLDVLLHRSTRAAGGDEPRAPADHGVPVPDRAVGVDGPARLLLGHRPDGTPDETDVTGHIVVIGTGVLAAAVFEGIAEQVRAAAERDDDVRGAPSERVPPLPEGTAVLARLDRAGHPHGTVVLVPGLGTMPRVWDVVVEVTRYGCTVRRPADRRGVALRPTLPVLDP